MKTLPLQFHSAKKPPQKNGTYLVITDNQNIGGTVIQWQMGFFNGCWANLDDWGGRVVWWAELPNTQAVYKTKKPRPRRKDP